MKTMLAITMAAVAACSARATALRTNDWFSVSASEQRGGALAASAGATLAEEDGTFVIGGDVGHRVAFTTAPGNVHADGLGAVTLRLVANTVPKGGLPTLKPTDKTAVTLCDDGHGRAFAAWVGGAWIRLVPVAADASLPDEGETYTLVIRLDRRSDAHKAQFAYRVDGGKGETVLAKDGESWFALSAPWTTDTFGVGFVGEGEVESVCGARLQVVAEIEVNDVRIAVGEADMARFARTRPADCATADDFLRMDAKEAFGAEWKGDAALKVAEAYAFGLVAASGDRMSPVNGGRLEVKADATAPVADKLPLVFAGGVKPRGDAGATVAYELKGSRDGVTWDELGTFAAPEVPMEKVGTEDGKYSRFKVVMRLTEGAK